MALGSLAFPVDQNTVDEWVRKGLISAAPVADLSPSSPIPHFGQIPALAPAPSLPVNALLSTVPAPAGPRRVDALGAFSSLTTPQPAAPDMAAPASPTVLPSSPGGVEGANILSFPRVLQNGQRIPLNLATGNVTVDPLKGFATMADVPETPNEGQIQGQIGGEQSDTGLLTGAGQPTVKGPTLRQGPTLHGPRPNAPVQTQPSAAKQLLTNIATNPMAALQFGAGQQALADAHTAAGYAAKDVLHAFDERGMGDSTFAGTAAAAAASGTLAEGLKQANAVRAQQGQTAASLQANAVEQLASIEQTDLVRRQQAVRAAQEQQAAVAMNQQKLEAEAIQQARQAQMDLLKMAQTGQLEADKLNQDWEKFLAGQQLDLYKFENLTPYQQATLMNDFHQTQISQQNADTQQFTARAAATLGQQRLQLDTATAMAKTYLDQEAMNGKWDQEQFDSGMKISDYLLRIGAQTFDEWAKTTGLQLQGIDQNRLMAQAVSDATLKVMQLQQNADQFEKRLTFDQYSTILKESMNYQIAKGGWETNKEVSFAQMANALKLKDKELVPVYARLAMEDAQFSAKLNQWNVENMRGMNREAVDQAVAVLKNSPGRTVVPIGNKMQPPTGYYRVPGSEHKIKEKDGKEQLVAVYYNGTKEQYDAEQKALQFLGSGTQDPNLSGAVRAAMTQGFSFADIVRSFQQADPSLTPGQVLQAITPTGQ